VLLLTIPQFLLFSLQLLTLRSHMASMASTRYSLLATVQAVCSTALAIGLVVYIAPSPEWVVVGMSLGYAALLIVDWRNVAQFFHFANADKKVMGNIWLFGWPIAATAVLDFSISKGSRFLLQGLLGSEAVGLYTAAYSLAEQAILSVFMIIVMASHPLAVRSLENDDAATIKKQLEHNALWIFGLGLPAAVGFAFLAPEMAGLFLGENFRGEAVKIMPWVAFATFLSGVKAHYIDHSFHLAKKNTVLLYVLIPAAIFNIAANLVLIPRFGLMGAVYAGCMAYIIAIITTFWAARRVFPLPLPVRGIAKIVLASAAMGAFLASVQVSSLWLSLGIKLLGGIAVYSLCAVILNVEGVRGVVRRKRG
jgi:O-antigen/teichoic acid export membrane protein